MSVQFLLVASEEYQNGKSLGQVTAILLALVLILIFLRRRNKNKKK